MGTTSSDERTFSDYKNNIDSANFYCLDTITIPEEGTIPTDHIHDKKYIHHYYPSCLLSGTKRHKGKGQSRNP